MSENSNIGTGSETVIETDPLSNSVSRKEDCLLNDLIHWKFVAAVDILAFVVLLISGILGGVSFWALVVRALIAIVLFAVFAVGINILVVKMYPELLTIMTSDPDGSAETGAVVDIMSDAGEHTISQPFQDESESYESVNTEGDAGLETDGASRKPGSKSQSLAESFSNEHSPALMAKAIRSVIVKDEKG